MILLKTHCKISIAVLLAATTVARLFGASINIKSLTPAFNLLTIYPRILSRRLFISPEMAEDISFTICEMPDVKSDAAPKNPFASALILLIKAKAFLINF